MKKNYTCQHFLWQCHVCFAFFWLAVPFHFFFNYSFCFLFHLSRMFYRYIISFSCQLCVFETLIQYINIIIKLSTSSFNSMFFIYQSLNTRTRTRTRSSPTLCSEAQVRVHIMPKEKRHQPWPQRHNQCCPSRCACHKLCVYLLHTFYCWSRMLLVYSGQLDNSSANLMNN